MSQRYLAPTNLFYRAYDPSPQEVAEGKFPEPNTGDVYFNTDSNDFRVYYEGSWHDRGEGVAADPRLVLRDGDTMSGPLVLYGDPQADYEGATRKYVEDAVSAVSGGGGDVSGLAPLASPTFTGDPKAPTPAQGDNDTSIATTAYVTGKVNTVDGRVTTVESRVTTVEGSVTAIDDRVTAVEAGGVGGITITIADGGPVPGGTPVGTVIVRYSTP